MSDSPKCAVCGDHPASVLHDDLTSPAGHPFVPAAPEPETRGERTPGCISACASDLDGVFRHHVYCRTYGHLSYAARAARGEQPEPRKTVELVISLVPAHQVETLRSIIEEVLQNDDELPANLPFEFRELVAYDHDFRIQYGDPDCKCGHQYHRHFDGYADDEAVGCKYCHCRAWEAPR